MIGLNHVLYFEYRDRWVYVEYIEESWHSVELLREINFGKIRKLNIKFKKPWRIEGYTVWILNNFLQSNFSSIEKIESLKSNFVFRKQQIVEKKSIQQNWQFAILLFAEKRK